MNSSEILKIIFFSKYENNSIMSVSTTGMHLNITSINLNFTTTKIPKNYLLYIQILLKNITVK
jgi:hypothetical protein